ncbi:MAG: hypothetical protein JJU29_19880 [Verrucomicrobia bacterium]|nr:hypothetical protein [Verrucomicrobiota bacterium]
MKILSLLLVCFAARSVAQLQVELEGGRVWTGRADVRIPNDEGTRFSFVDDLDADAANYHRIRIGGTLGERHRVFFTWAPLEVEAAGSFDRDTRFADTLFPADSPVKGTYGFDNYRLTYRYRLRDRGRFRTELGGTLFVRDAEITLRSGSLTDSDDDFGFVPLLSGRLEADLAPGWMLVADGDALVGPQGRAIDILLGLEASPRDHLRIGLGYRILEGGADVDQVYTFALFHHLAFTLNWRF